MPLKTLIIILIVATVIFVGGVFIFNRQMDYVSEIKYTKEFKNTKEKKQEKVQQKENLIDLVSDSVLFNVPFIAQAPFENWDNPVFQDGCEEASILLAMLWIENKTITKEEAQKKIMMISEFEQNTYGEYRDRSAEDTSQLIKDYYNYQKVKFQNNISIEDIKLELRKGNLVITPMNGRALNNPFYTPPGPERHMLVIKGYDENTKEFITNDVGTRHGENYRYPEHVLYQAIRDYETGYHTPILEVRKTMIIVEWPYKTCFENDCFNVELADIPEKQSLGLMYREKLEKNWGMFFLFEAEKIFPFWMRNTLIPLDIIWIDDDYKVVYIKENAQPCQIEDCPNIIPDKKAKYVLEINAGISDKIDIEIGDRVDLKF